jgi:type I restriction-modification system DNA methylase subunit
MALYQNSVLKKYLKQQDEEAVAKAFKRFTKYFHDSKIQENIRSSKEEEYQGIFLTELFSKILGYTMKPNDNFNLVAEYKNEKNSKKADGAILKNDIAIGVIELKGTNTKDLEKVRQQAFDYKANQTGCVYVITSNFEKIRFYINNAVEFEEFHLFTLNQDRFNLLYLCLAKDNLLNHVPLKIKEASVQEEEAITKQFYKDYSTFKRELFRDLVKLNMKNEIFRAELTLEDAERATKNIKQNLFQKSQKLIDRFLFIFFAEDRGLLPPNSTIKILEQWDKLKDMDAYTPLYNRYKLYFNYLDTGRKGTDKSAEIFAYNGGLFKPDAVLDSLLITDELLFKHTKDLQAYDFESQVDVNILGHIFENSLNEIESVNAEIEGTDFDKQTTKRKKDGVFYTPKYITKYIVDNTVGKLCDGKKVEFNVVEEEYLKNRKGRTKDKLRDLTKRLDQYRTWLLNITICDPACGSGAFLNQALDFLIKEHSYIDELQTALLGGGLIFPDIENTILENNIFGVDLNEESVEIAKLSLWLRTAQPRRKLNDLNGNVKCGNSLIESKAIAGNKAFKWEEEFPHVFDKGGFDVVIGNPPYVRSRELFTEEDKKYYLNNYITTSYQLDLYKLFIEKSCSLININGKLSFITPVLAPNKVGVIY